MDINTFRDYIGLGVAGNFAHHLEQAGEIVDFAHVKVDDENAPKGIFPFYVPNFDTFLGTYPLSNDTITYIDDKSNLQIEPEIALLCKIIYAENQVIDIVPEYFGAYNDCSIRKPNAKKISEKKNWGANTKGISQDLIPIDKFEYGGVMDSYSIACFLKRDDAVYEYGKNSLAITYSYFYTKLKEWIITKLNTQEDFGPLEDIPLYLQKSSYPQNMVISIGATSYTEFGESTYLNKNDNVYVVIYDTKVYDYETIQGFIKNSDIKEKKNISILHQIVI